MEHIVLFQFKDGTSEEEIAALEREVIRLREKIPVIVDIAFGANFTKRGKNFTHALVARLAKEDDLDVYLEHPEHQRVLADLIKPIVADVIAVDFNSERFRGTAN